MGTWLLSTSKTAAPIRFATQQVRGRRELSRPDELLLLVGQVSREACDTLREHPYPPFCDFDVGENVCGGKLILLALRRLAGIRARAAT